MKPTSGSNDLSAGGPRSTGDASTHLAVEVVEYRTTWTKEFRRIGAILRDALGDLALRIDHIGSTSVPRLAAKDVIDVQLTVHDFDPEIRKILESCGYRERPILADHVPPDVDGPEDDWQKWVFTEPLGLRRVNLHVRQAGRPNQRYPLLFRDYLRAKGQAAAAYARVKLALARLHPVDREAYYAVKDPVFDVIMEGAEAWSEATGWKPGQSDC